jgi:PBSX family phage portal protein
MAATKKTAKKRATRNVQTKAESAPKAVDNGRLLRAIVVSGREDIKKQKSNALDPVSERYPQHRDYFIEPPYEPDILAMLPENSSELVQIIEAMEVNIEGFGQRVIVREMEDDMEEKYKKEIKKEQMDLKGLVELPNAEDNLTSLRRKTRKEIEIFGYAFWEVLISLDGSLAGLNHIESRRMRLVKKDIEFTQIEKRYLDEDFNWITKKFYKKFRRFLQIVGNKKVYFKEWDDPRFIDKRTGDVMKNPSARDVRNYAATGIIHFNNYSARTPYGLPRVIGNLFSVFGSRASDVINFQTFSNNNVPSMIITVSNGMLTQDTIDRVEEFVNSHIKRSDNYSKFLILEAETQDEEIQGAGAMKIDVKPMTDQQRDDQLFQKYDGNNSEKIRRAFRLPGIFVGKTENINRATAEASRRLADEQVFSPEREEIDRKLNALLIHFGYKFVYIKSNSPNVTDDQALTKVLSGAEKSGALTPNLARQIVGEILNKELDPLEKTEKMDPDIPFSLTIAEAVKKQDGIAPNQGQMGDGKDSPEPKKPETPQEKQLRLVESFFEYMDNPTAVLDDDIGIDVFAEGDEDDEFEDE